MFGIWIFARWPESVEGYPRFDVNNLVAYIVAFLYTADLIWYAVICQAYLARFFRIQRLSRSIYEKSLEGFKAQEDIPITPDKPLPPSE